MQNVKTQILEKTMKKIVLLLTFASLSNLSAAESSQKQQVPEWTTAELEAKTFPPIPKPRMVPVLQSLGDIAFKTLHKEESPTIINSLMEKNNVELIHMFLFAAQKYTTTFYYLMRLLEKSQSAEMAKAIIHAPGFNVHARDDFNDQTPLHVACYRANSKIVELLIAAGADVNANDSYEQTPLHWACDMDNSKIVELLIAAGANVNAKNDYGITPLHSASYDKGDSKIIELLIAAHADVNANDSDGQTPLHYCKKNLECAKLLIAAHADVNAQDKYGQTPLHSAPHGECDSKIVELLIATYANVNANDSYGKTPLHYYLDPKNVQLLIKASADVNARNNRGDTPLHMHLENEEIVTLLIAAGADVDAQNFYVRNTPLHCTTNLECAKLFIKAGANPCIQNCADQFPHNNWSGGRQKICEYLEQEYNKRMALMEIHKQAFAQIHAKRKN